jgi:DNA repair protein RadC
LETRTFAEARHAGVNGSAADLPPPEARREGRIEPPLGPVRNRVALMQPANGGDHLGTLGLRLLADDDDLGSRDLLDLCLGLVLPPEEARGLAAALWAHFGNLGSTLAAPPERLQELFGMNDGALLALKTIHAAARRVTREPVEERPVIGSASALFDYLSVTMRHESRELIRILFLDRRNGLIKDELHSRGTVDHVPLYPREIVRRVLELEASALILVHNHPSGDPTPSKEDVSMTRTLVDTLRTINVLLHDHVIVGRNRELSMRQRGLLKD